MNEFRIHIEGRRLWFEHDGDEYTCEAASDASVEDSISVGKITYFEAVHGQRLADILTLPPKERTERLGYYLKRKEQFESNLDVVRLYVPGDAL